MKTNIKASIPTAVNHQGGAVRIPTATQELRRTVLACLLWENQFYEKGNSTADRIAALIPMVDAKVVAQIAIEARTKMHLRHAPLFIVSEMCRYAEHRKYVRATLNRVIERADELAEFLAIYYKGTTKAKRKLAKSAQRGLADAFKKFSEYDLGKYKQEDAAFSLRDVLFIVHPKPSHPTQQEVWNKLAKKELAVPDTWEVGISAAKTQEAKAAEWTRLITENKLGAFALIRNLRNLTQAGVDSTLVRQALRDMKADRILPFRFIAAVRHAPAYAAELEAAMLKNLAGMPKLPGHTIILLDISGSMFGAKLSDKSEMDRSDAACGLAVLARELCETVQIFTFSHQVVEVAPYHGLGLVKHIVDSQEHGGTYLGRAVSHINPLKWDRLIVLTDGQSSDLVPNPRKNGYIINIAAYKNGVGYGAWKTIDGWSEHVLTYIRENEDLDTQ